MKNLMFLISTEGKPKEQEVEESLAAWRKYNNAQKPVDSSVLRTQSEPIKAKTMTDNPSPTQVIFFKQKPTLGSPKPSLPEEPRP